MYDAILDIRKELVVFLNDQFLIMLRWSVVIKPELAQGEAILDKLYVIMLFFRL